MKDLAELLAALGSLLWLVAVVGLIVWFRKPLADILSAVAKVIDRLRRGKFLGQEFELEKALDVLQASATAAEAEVSALPPSTSTASSPIPAIDAVADKILREANTSPKLALISLAREIESEIRVLMAVSGWGPSQGINTPAQGLVFLRNSGILPAVLAGSIRHFYETRAQVVHAGNATDDDALRAIDSGMALLRAVQAIPRETNIVEYPNVPIFKDRGLTAPHDGHAVMLRTISPGGTSETFRIYPTTKNHFQKGRRVAWEWDLDRTWGEAWYRDPKDGKVEPAWAKSGEFIGRHLDDP